MLKTPWHLWVIGLLSLIWNGMGAMDFTMSITHNPAYLEMMPPEQLAFLENFPTWTTVTWGIAVIGAVLGSLLLLLRQGLAAPVFLIAFVAMIATTVHNLFLASPSALELMDTPAAAFSAVIFVVALLLVIYSGVQRGRGVLR